MLIDNPPRPLTLSYTGLASNGRRGVMSYRDNSDGPRLSHIIRVGL